MNKPQIFYGWYIVIASWIMTSLIASGSVSVFFKPMLEDFRWDRAMLSSVQSVAMIALTIILPFLGRLIDRFGPRAMILVCVVTQVLSRLLNGVANNIGHLYFARFLYGVNVLPSTHVLINRWFIKRRGTALGIASTAVATGTLILAPITQYLILIWGWRPTMLFWATVTLSLMLPLALILINDPEDKGLVPDGETPDRVRLIHPAPDLGVTTLPETLTTDRIFNFLEVTNMRSFWFLSIAQLICGIGCGFMMTHIVIFATDVGYSDMIGASLVSVQGGLNLVGVLVTGLLSDKILRKNVLALTHLARSLSFATIVLFILIGGGSLWLLYVAMVLFGFGWFTTAPLTSGLVADLFGKLRMGTILGVVTACHMFGAAVGAYAGGAIFELTHSYYLFFIIQGLLEFIAVIFSISIKYKRNII